MLMTYEYLRAGIVPMLELEGGLKEPNDGNGYHVSFVTVIGD
jgi:hypothetical protein